ncbi:PAS/PAC sensor signal transduction histidine kinase [Novosphingobium aromaticivorans DSM 12444]|uniref:histidine kinase n=1 Tax=Novosphingobium aromaticivorans (strain ATCC 700278 / DSM 12444 / CCUG 56034 / CIP 105152 / NBRC 16084 / F199) TaxID=279238 RepID=Q2G6T2_NOVAD|nr:PAS domain-containing sensor histidine kinase [Novosphingobium aromaticivorans]ABD26441.1 PAS/PAC sensor signal transduction histidine kinase [Novosphingobium aromaticivorans DSM 12444]SCY77807.1 PAS/PAC sensor signal transduction histidine kinase [Novosphingobium aromaticivorans]
MPLLNQTALVLIGLLLAAWTVGAGWLVLDARRRARRGEALQRQARRLARMVDESPALPLLVRADGRIEGPARLALWLGFEAMPGYLSELDAGDHGLDEVELARLGDAVRRAQKTGTPFRMALTPRGGSRSLCAQGHLADPQVSPGGAALVWFFDVSESEEELVALRAETRKAKSDFAGLSGLIEAAPLPMWFRGPDLRLRLVNSAYVAAVGAESADQVIAQGIELIEPVEGLSAAQVARQAHSRKVSIERSLLATIKGQRRAVRVTDLPLGDEGVAGYVVDIEEMEELIRQFRRFREAQREMLDTLSAGIAQFDEKRNLVFANQPFLRIFSVPQAWVVDTPPFDRVLDRMRDAGRLPEVRDFPEWRRERQGWFLAREPIEEPWHLSDGTHLRVVGQPMPDGGLLMIFEDRTEQLQLSATRDTLLRTRTATFDNLFESLAVFAPDGRLQLWNRRFAADWGLDEEFLATHPRADVLLSRIADQLKRPAQVGTVAQVIQGATLERKQRSGRLALADGRHLALAGVPLPDGNGLLTVLDITDSQKAEAALRERNAALVEADAVKTRFIANMSYEFRTPLTSIGGFAELLQSGIAGDLTEQQNEYVEAILTSVERLGEQIENVLDLSQSEAGTLPLAQEPVEIFPLLTDVVTERTERLAGAGITLDLRGDRSAGMVTGDARRLRRAFGQLIDNAIAATPEGGRILVEASRKKGGALQVVVSDNGRGMEPAVLARALDGLKVSADGKAVERRQGLGLPLVRQLVEAHGGNLELMSEPGLGTSAIVMLP